MAAHAAPVSVTPAADSEARRGVAAVPVMYDLRFAVSTVAPTLVRATPTVFDRPAPALSIALPPELTEPAKEQPEPESTVAALQPDAPVSVPPDAPSSAASDAPAKLDTPAEAPKPATQAVAAVQPQATPELEASTAEALIPEPDTTASVDAPDQSVDPAPAAVPPATTPPAAAQRLRPSPRPPRSPRRRPSPNPRARRASAPPIAPHRRTNVRHNPASNPFGTP